MSYFFSVPVKKYVSPINGTIEINMLDGKKTVDILNTNYSYGVLQKILHKALKHINFDREIKTVLALGMGAGSIVETIRQHFHSQAFIELVEIDAQIIAIAKEEFEIEKFANISIVNADAYEYVQQTNKKFDLIIIDVFVVDTIPEKFTGKTFIDAICLLVKPSGYIIYNTMQSTMSRKVLDEMKLNFAANNFTIDMMMNVHQTNDVIIAQKI
nr:fused MFS/spermidine synthase [Bacteroidota bacterium]